MSCLAHDLAISRRYLTVEDVDTIQHVVDLLPMDKDCQVIDLGAGSGTTALSVLCHRNTNIQVITFDISQENLNWTQLAIANAGYQHLWQGINRSSIDIVDDFLSVDLVLIDADHSYDAVQLDLATWLPRTQYIWCHDYIGEPGVKKAVHEAMYWYAVRQLGISGLGWYGIAE